MSSIPSESASERYRASHGITYERFVAQRLDTALIQKMEHREVRSKLRVPSEAELHRAFDADPERPSGAIHVVALVRVGRGCGRDQVSRAADVAHRAVLAQRRSHGHRLALEDRGASLSSDVQPFDVHVDTKAVTRFVVPYGHENLESAPEQMPARIGELVASWSKLSPPGSVFGPECSEGAIWVAIKAKSLPETAGFEQVRDEYEQRAETEALREAFVGWLATVKREAHVRILDATRS
jgi:hypothetical protein